MDQFILLFLCLLIGLALQWTKAFPANAHLTLNQFIIYICLPAIAFYYIPGIEVNASLLFPIGVAWITFAGSFIFFRALSKYFGWSKSLTGCLIITAGLGNTSFIGFPVIETLYGKEGLKTAVILDQTGSFLVLTTFGIATAAYYSRGANSNVGDMIKKIVLFPPFIAFLLAVLMIPFGLQFEGNLKFVFEKLGAIVTPLALVSVGLQLKFERKSQHWEFLGLGLLYKLILTPVLIYLIYVIAFGGKGKVVEVCLMEAAMPSMITATIVSAAHGLKPRLSSMMIGFGIPLSALTLMIWYVIAKTI
ncbi:MAG: AEC family transporter [Cytophagaceae bacterium]|nr:AEC family transporter [Cytophagaceae bacterium]